MKVFLLYRDQDFDLNRELTSFQEALIQDLELNAMFEAMAQGDKFLFEVSQKVVLNSLSDPEAILFRQQILRDCLKSRALIDMMYDIAIEAIASEKKAYFGFFSRHPDGILNRAIEVLQMLIVQLRKLRQIADDHQREFDSEGFSTLFSMLQRELDNAYFMTIQKHLAQLKFKKGVLISAKLGVGGKGTDYTLRKPHETNKNFVQQLFEDKPPSYSFQIADRDESGYRALSELNDRGVNLAANALAQSVDHILSFFGMLRTELAFYRGCLNLHQQLTAQGETVCFPVPAPTSIRLHTAVHLYDVSLALTLKQKIVANDLAADDKNLIIITGANQGGKTTFLRAVGTAQLMMQCGMFVAAESFRANVSDKILTHFKREEDATMTSGKLDEELSRMGAVVDHISSSSLLLFNESFAATNEREGSEIARQIVRALLENQ